jgi:release factor glutamine methyltransferase
MITVGEALAEATRRLGAAGIDSARLDARALLAHVLHTEPMRLFSRPERRLDAGQAGRFQDLVARRERREPLSHITGYREFWSLKLQVTPATLDPRPDTETVVEAVLDALPDRRATLRLLDLGTGTGCLLLALLSELPNATGIGVDASAEACAVAAQNLRSLGLAERAEIRQGDWGRGLDGCFDVITSNPPYIPERDVASLQPEVALYEPRQALAAGIDGLDCYRVLAPQIAGLLAPGGIAALEVGRGQASAVAALMAAAGLEVTTLRMDLAGVERCVLARRRHRSP